MQNSKDSPCGIIKPIILLGAARSGTHLLSQCLENHPSVAYISEPSVVWRAYNSDIGHDMLPLARASPKVKEYIRGRFNKMRLEMGGARIFDKTPSNTMRLPFVLEVFPDAKLIHIVRDGRDVAVSAHRKFKGNTNKVTTTDRSSTDGGATGNFGNLNLVKRRLRHRLNQGVRIGDIPYLMPKVIRSTAGLVGLKKQYSWGPEFPGMRSMMKTHPLIEVCAAQWQNSVESVLNVFDARPDVPHMDVTFERLVSDYEGVAREIFDFAELEQPDTVFEFDARGFDVKSKPFETEFTLGERSLVMDRIASTLYRLGYE